MRRLGREVEAPWLSIYDLVSSTAGILSSLTPFLTLWNAQPMEIYVDNDAKLTLHGLVQVLYTDQGGLTHVLCIATPRQLRSDVVKCCSISDVVMQ